MAAGGDETDDNLVYACFRCNLFKGEFHPTPEDRAKGHIVLHPLREDMWQHVRFEEATGLLQPLTETGRFHVSLLHLNRPALVAFRLRRRFAELLLRRKRLVDEENAELKAIIRAQEKYIAHLKGLMQGHPDIGDERQ